MPSSEVLIQIARTTGVNLNWLLLGKEGKEIEELRESKIIESPNASVASITTKALRIQVPSFQIIVNLTDAPASEGNNIGVEHIPLYETAPAQAAESEQGVSKRRKDDRKARKR